MDILNIFLNLKLFVGFIRNGVFPPKLTEEEEAELILKLFNSDTHDYAREKLIEHNLRLVAHIVKKYDNTREDQDDLIINWNNRTYQSCWYVFFFKKC